MRVFFICLIVAVCLAACAPASVTRIGPTMAPKADDCEIEILAQGEVPTRPYRDIGAVTLKNCNEYTAGLCREMLRKKACELGGQVAYAPDERLEITQAGPITYMVMVAVYVADLRPEPGELSTPTATVNAADCDNPPTKKENEEEPERCLD